MRSCLSICAAATLLAACGGAQPPVGSQGAMPQSVSRAGENIKGQDLIYAMGPKTTYILSYADGSIINSFNQTAGYAGLCSDRNGNVFMPARTMILEYAHGGTSPIAELNDGNYRPLGCSVDPTTGDLAVANIDSNGGSGPGSIAVFKNASGSPSFYSDARIANYFSCGYDKSGNLFLDGARSGKPFIFAELPNGSSNFQIFNLNRGVRSPGSVQWDGKHVAVGAYGARLIYRIAVSGSNATIVGVTRLYKQTPANFTFWLHGSTLLTAAGAHDGSVGLWR